MCGICGSIRADRPADPAPVQRMRQALVHRGPDGEGQLLSGRVALGVRRLSIIDLNGGWQPLYNEDRSVALVMNGEIYNYVELRRQLAARGHRFRSEVDCEVVVHLYEDYGLDFVQHLRGMFAIALWDQRRGRLVLARDRIGEKPLYLYEADGLLLFASELKGLLASGLVPFELDPVAVDLFFHYQYVPEPRTALKGVRKLPAGHLLVVDTEPWTVSTPCYWRLQDAPPLDGDPGELLIDELLAISEIIVRADVPLGIALSGGLDSSSVAALLARERPGGLHAFSVGYQGSPRFDERAAAKAVAEHLRLPFHDVELGVADVVASFPSLVVSWDDPIADMAGYGYRAIMQLARAHDVPVIFQGQGGDELFWGYPYVREAVEDSLRRVADWDRARAGPDALPPGQISFYDLTPEFQLAQARMAALYQPEFAAAVRYAGPTSLFRLSPPWEHPDVQVTKGIMEIYLLENGVAQGDRLSMASSVELRLPLLDYRFVETVVGLRKTRSDHRLPPKAWLRAALRHSLPEWVTNRPKQPFSTPFLDWCLALLASYGEQLDDGYLVQAGVLRGEAAKELRCQTYPTGPAASLAFKALVLEFWCRLLGTGAIELASSPTEARSGPPSGRR
jgi:asparagine synthase (glutamine-hydrolysing)